MNQQLVCSKIWSNYIAITAAATRRASVKIECAAVFLLPSLMYEDIKLRIGLLFVTVRPCEATDQVKRPIFSRRLREQCRARIRQLLVQSAIDGLLGSDRLVCIATIKCCKIDPFATTVV